MNKLGKTFNVPTFKDPNTSSHSTPCNKTPPLQNVFHSDAESPRTSVHTSPILSTKRVQTATKTFLSIKTCGHEKSASEVPPSMLKEKSIGSDNNILKNNANEVNNVNNTNIQLRGDENILDSGHSPTNDYYNDQVAQNRHDKDMSNDSLLEDDFIRALGNRNDPVEEESENRNNPGETLQQEDLHENEDIESESVENNDREQNIPRKYFRVNII